MYKRQVVERPPTLDVDVGMPSVFPDVASSSAQVPAPGGAASGMLDAESAELTQQLHY